MLNFKDIAKIFEEIELRLIASLKRNLMHHKAEEIREDRQWTAWQAIKLQNLQKFRRENRQIMQEYSDKIDADTRQLMTEQFREGEQEAEEVTGAEPAASVPDVHFFGVNTPKMERLMQDVVQVEQTAETAALRTMDDVYRRTVNRAQLAMAAGETTLTKAIDMAVREFLEKGLNSIVYRDGRHVDIADYVRMVLRTTSTRAQLQGKSKRFAELGYDTVLISQYGGCSETCEPWQGRAYIDDVFTIWNGEINGDSGKSLYCGKWFPLLSSAIRGGLFHPNCRHTMGLYIDGVTKIPPPIPAEQIRKQRELEQKQRVMERKIRKLKRLEAGTQDPQAVKEYGRKLKQAQQELKAFADEHRDVLRRDYEREKYYAKAKNKSIQIQGGFDETTDIAEDIKAEITKSIEEIQSEYDVKVDEFTLEDISEEYGKVPFQFQPVNNKGLFKSRFVINRGFNWEENLDKLNERIYNRNYKRGILAAQNTKGLIEHEMAHFMSFQDCKSYNDFVRRERELRSKYIYGVSAYSDSLEDGAETIAEGFVRIRSGEKVDERVKSLVDEYVERWRK
ncbi:phage minor capsid protein [Ruminococcus champanellensis]|uniref:phage minor capsid protein n=1 Tax=Ruminococcus champanellensis TaxID=1161942 RepID=UPI0039F5A2A2